MKEPSHKNTWGSAASDFQRKTDGSIDFDIGEKPVVSTYIDNAWHYDRDTSPNGGRRDLLVSENIRPIPTENIKVPVPILVGSEGHYVSTDLCKEAYNTLSNQKDSELVTVNGAAHAMLMEHPYYKLVRERD